MSLVNHLILAERFGYVTRLNLEQLGEVLDLSKGTIENQIARDEFPIPTYRDGGKRWADLRDVIAHFDRCRERAHAETQGEAERSA